MSDTDRLATFTRWLADGQSWIGVFENRDLGHADRGRRVAFPFSGPEAKLHTRAPDHALIGLGWRYLLVEVCRTPDAAMNAMRERPAGLDGVRRR